jgi:organic radical activating enzyme
VFCRFAGCNLWSGRERDRADAVCKFCDTDFVGTDGTGGGRFADAAALAGAIAAEWPGGGRPFVVCTGGEPLLQLDDVLITALHERGFEVAVETNGTVGPAPAGLDWICVSPKAGAPLRLVDFTRFSVQPMDGPRLAANTRVAVETCLRRPRWQLSLQTHKLLGIR